MMSDIDRPAIPAYHNGASMVHSCSEGQDFAHNEPGQLCSNDAGALSSVVDDSLTSKQSSGVIVVGAKGTASSTEIDMDKSIEEHCLTSIGSSGVIVVSACKQSSGIVVVGAKGTASTPSLLSAEIDRDKDRKEEHSLTSCSSGVIVVGAEGTVSTSSLMSTEINRYESGEQEKDMEVCSIVIGAAPTKGILKSSSNIPSALLQETHPRARPAETHHGLADTEMFATEETNEEMRPGTMEELESELETLYRIVQAWQSTEERWFGTPPEIEPKTKGQLSETEHGSEALPQSQPRTMDSEANATIEEAHLGTYPGTEKAGPGREEAQHVWTERLEAYMKTRAVDEIQPETLPQKPPMQPDTEKTQPGCICGTQAVTGEVQSRTKVMPGNAVALPGNKNSQMPEEIQPGIEEQAQLETDEVPRNIELRSEGKLGDTLREIEQPHLISTKAQPGIKGTQYGSDEFQPGHVVTQPVAGVAWTRTEAGTDVAEPRDKKAQKPAIEESHSGEIYGSEEEWPRTDEQQLRTEEVPHEIEQENVRKLRITWCECGQPQPVTVKAQLGIEQMLPGTEDRQSVMLPGSEEMHFMAVPVDVTKEQILNSDVTIKSTVCSEVTEHESEAGVDTLSDHSRIDESTQTDFIGL